jgi:cell division protein FtsN
MKYVLISLLLINLGYLGLRLIVPPTNKAQTITTRTNPAVNTIMLLEEAVSSGDREADMSAVVSNPVRMVEGATDTCLVLGPFDDVFSGQNALEQLAALGQALELKAVDTETGQQDHRVLIPPATSAEEAFRKLRELQASKIDSYVITQGPQAMGISLGVFSTVEAAEGLKSRLQGKGYDSEIIKIQRLSRTYWVFPRDNSIIEAQNWLADRPELELKPMSCTDP